MFLVSLSISYQIKGNIKQEINEAIKVIQETQQSKINSVFTWGIKFISPIITAVSLVYIITLIALVLIVTKIITENQSFNILFLSILSLVGVLLPFFVNKFDEFAEGGKINEIFHGLADIKEKESPKGWHIFLKIIELGRLIIILRIIVLPLGAFLITYSLISDYLFLIIVLILQITLIIISGSYFSSLSVKKELTNTLTNFANLDYLINDFILRKDINEEQVKKTKELYLTAKQYDVLVNDSLKFVNFYFLSMNDVYLNRK